MTDKRAEAAMALLDIMDRYGPGSYTAEAIGALRAALEAESDDTEYVCVHGHDRCNEMYPGPDCPYCEKRAVVTGGAAPDHCGLYHDRPVEEGRELSRKPMVAGGATHARIAELEREYNRQLDRNERLSAKVIALQAQLAEMERERDEAQAAKRVLQGQIAIGEQQVVALQAKLAERDPEKLAQIGLAAIQFAHKLIGGLPVTPPFEDKLAAQKVLESARDALREALSGRKDGRAE